MQFIRIGLLQNRARHTTLVSRNRGFNRCDVFVYNLRNAKIIYISLESLNHLEYFVVPFVALACLELDIFGKVCVRIHRSKIVGQFVFDFTILVVSIYPIKRESLPPKNYDVINTQDCKSPILYSLNR